MTEKSSGFWHELWQPPKFWGYRICSVLAALLIWGFVIISQNPQADTLFTVPLETRNLSSELALLDTTNQVQVRVHGSSSDLSKLNSSSISAYIDLSGVNEGSTALEVKVSLPKGIQLVSVTPETVDVTLEAISTGSFPLEIETSGTPAAGYTLLDAVPTPGEVTISGAREYLERVNKVLVRADVSGLDSNFNKSLAVQVFDAGGSNITDHLTVAPSFAEVIIPVVYDLPEKSVAVNASIVGQPAEGYEVKRIIVEPSTVRVFGNISTLSSLYYLETEPINISDMRKTYSGKVELVHSDNVTVSQETVTVIVQIEPVSIASYSREVISAQNLTAGLKCNMPAIQVTLKVAGDDDAIAAIGANDLTPYVDCSGITSAGEYTLPLSVALPDDLSLVSVSPELITVTVTAGGQ